MKIFYPFVSIIIMFSVPIFGQLIEGEKGVAKDDGLERAVKDIRKYKEVIENKNDQQLFEDFVVESALNRVYGSYEYYYGYMVNDLIKKEILRRHSEKLIDRNVVMEFAKDRRELAQAINGQKNNTISSFCLGLK